MKQSASDLFIERLGRPSYTKLIMELLQTVGMAILLGHKFGWIIGLTFYVLILRLDRIASK